jgi:hypothetical protein
MWLADRPRVILLLIVALGLLVTALHRGPLYAGGDGPDYLAGAYHLYHDHVFSQAETPNTVSAGIGREPLYSVVLAGLMAMDPALRSYTTGCIHAACDVEIYRSAALVNLALIVLNGVALYFVGALATGRPLGGLVAAGYVLFNLQTNKGWGPIASDRLAVLALSLAMLAAAHAWGTRGWRWLLVGLALAVLTLTKTVFLYYTIAAVGVAAVVAFANRRKLRPVGQAAILTVAVFAAIVGGWTARNAHVSGQWRLTDARGGIALNTREVFNHMSAPQYAASFVYWMRGPGEGLARKLFPPAVVKPFDLDQPGGFYDAGQNGYGIRVAERMKATGEDYWTAEHAVEREVRSAILQHPLIHLATTIPLFYRGIWGDEFVVIGLPLFLAAIAVAARERNWLMLTLLSIGAFNLVFYAAFSLNIPRYQMTALPSIAIGVGYMATRFAGRMRDRKLFT